MSLVLTLFAALQVAGAAPAQPAADFTPVRVSDSDIRGAVGALQRGRWRTALHFTEKALQAPRLSVRVAAHANRCIALWELGRHGDALTACETAAELAPENAQARANLAAAQTRLAALEH